MIITGEKVMRVSGTLIVISMTIITLLMYIGFLQKIDNYLLLYIVTLVGCGESLLK
ncbi:hypothetical protein AB3K25_00845 [Leuconostoc sp. MS02]|uniref:Uncharacterized protein n=1 Tax=Leuconostoc aquikimchii TaxID=3236804 RepID=A0ABV3S619_9LACO